MALVGLATEAVAGVKRLTLELGSNSPLVVLSDADIDDLAAYFSAIEISVGKLPGQ